MAQIPFVFTLILAAAVTWSHGSQVGVSSSAYSCCTNPELRFDPRCENTWTASGRTIARTGASKCISPCMDITDGLMRLDQCVEVEVTVVCDTASGLTEEKRTYKPEPCSGSPGSQGAAARLLLVATAGLIGWMMSSA